MLTIFELIFLCLRNFESVEILLLRGRCEAYAMSMLEVSGPLVFLTSFFPSIAGENWMREGGVCWVSEL